MPRHIRWVAVAIACVGLSVVTLGPPASAFFGSFAATCRDIRVYAGGTVMTAWCRRMDGSRRFTRISNCSGYGGHDRNGHLRCGA